MTKRKKLSLIFLILFSVSLVLSQIETVRAVTTDPELGDVTVNQVVPDTTGNKYVYDITAKETEDGFTIQETGLLAGIITGMQNFLNGSVVQATDAEGNPIDLGQGEYLYISQSGAVDSVVAMNQPMYDNPPASGIVYAQNQWNQITQGQKAYAAAEDAWIYYPGLGFNILNPIQDYWVAARNLAYVALIFIIIIVALMVIFRGYFGGQTQVTIANSIPNIIIALIMITLSYALSGLAIDVITIGVNLSQQVLVQNSFSPGYDVWQADTITTHPINPLHLTEIPEDLANEIDETDFLFEEDEPAVIGSEESPVRYHLQPDDQAMSVWGIFNTSNITIAASDVNIANAIPTGGITGSIKNIVAGTEDALDGLIDKLLALVLGLTAFMTAFKLFMELIKKYIVLVLYPVVSPFIMLTIAIPGQGSETISKYFKTLFAASLTFIAIYTVFLFMIVLTNDTGFIVKGNYTPALIGLDVASISNDTIPIGKFIMNILAYGLFLSTPMIPTVIDDMLTTPESFKKAPGFVGGGVRSRLAYDTSRLIRGGKAGYNKIAGDREEPEKRG